MCSAPEDWLCDSDFIALPQFQSVNRVNTSHRAFPENHIWRKRTFLLRIIMCHNKCWESLICWCHVSTQLVFASSFDISQSWYKKKRTFDRGKQETLTWWYITNNAKRNRKSHISGEGRPNEKHRHKCSLVGRRCEQMRETGILPNFVSGRRGTLGRAVIQWYSGPLSKLRGVGGKTDRRQSIQSLSVLWLSDRTVRCVRGMYIQTI